MRELQKQIDEQREACYARQAEIEKARNPARTLNGDLLAAALPKEGGNAHKTH
jgi:hypothetical protein